MCVCIKIMGVYVEHFAIWIEQSFEGKAFDDRTKSASHCLKSLLPSPLSSPSPSWFPFQRGGGNFGLVALSVDALWRSLFWRLQGPASSIGHFKNGRNKLIR